MKDQELQIEQLKTNINELTIKTNDQKLCQDDSHLSLAKYQSEKNSRDDLMNVRI